MFPKVKRNLKFFLYIQYEEGSAIINKIAPILNQLGLEETYHLDDFLFTFFTEYYHSDFENETIIAKINYSIWKNYNLFHQIKIKSFLFYEFCFKYQKSIINNFIFFKNFKIFKNNKDLKYRNFITFFFTLCILEGTSWNPDTGFQFFLLNFKNSLSSLIGIRRAYARRDEMLGRKINFRRKIIKKKFEDY